MENSRNKMLIDSTHPEETRVVVLRNGRVEEFDWESAARKLLRGNIYLAKVTRVEPSLQAAFVEYGGNRHGFLAFGEIHPDYYQIPVADRQALLREEAAAEEAKAKAEAAADAELPETDDDADPAETGASPEAIVEPFMGAPDPDLVATPPEQDSALRAIPLDVAPPASETLSEPAPLPVHFESASETAPYVPATPEAMAPADLGDEPSSPDRISHHGNGGDQQGASDEPGVIEVVEPEGNGPTEIETVGSEDAVEELPDRPRRALRQYKIQEVIRRRQIILVQVVKEERGNKGAALTTYLSLAGRYTVLMPNTARGGGISRKITNPADRKRLRKIVAELDVPQGMGLIVRTAGASRTKAEIKRDFEYLLRLWESVRDLTLRSSAPALVYEEGDLIKRSIRDLYTKEIDEIVVAGEHAYEDARNFMQMLMPSHTQNVVPFREPAPLFARYNIERQLNAMFSPFVTLRSGGYIVINQTEALVSVDVNSGKATREHNIEDTALKTNLEAAEEIARQLKLRDLAGLIVIDFIDMEEKRNNRAVERRLKEALRHDRARIQVGRISHFGLLEMSRQRLRPGVLEGSTSQCPHCQGTGTIRSTESVALAVLRGIEDKLMAGDRHNLQAVATASVALYILNQKRQFLNDMESRYGITISILASDKVHGANFIIERGPAVEARAPARRGNVIQMDASFHGPDRADLADEPEAEEEELAAEERAIEAEDEVTSVAGEGEGDGEPRRGRRRRRRRGRSGVEGQPRAAHGNGNGYGEELALDAEGGRDALEAGATDTISDEDRGFQEAVEDERPELDTVESGGPPARDERRGRRRGRRGGRRNRERQAPGTGPQPMIGGPEDPERIDAGYGGTGEASGDDWFRQGPTVGELAGGVGSSINGEGGVLRGRRSGGGRAHIAMAEPQFAAGEVAAVPGGESLAEPAISAAHSAAALQVAHFSALGIAPLAPLPEPSKDIEVAPPPTFVPPPVTEAEAFSAMPEPNQAPAAPEAVAAVEPPPPPPAPDPDRPRRSGWWQRRFSSS